MKTKTNDPPVSGKQSRFTAMESHAQRAKRKQRGFTAIEVGAAIAGGLLFVAAVAFGILRAIDNNRYSTLTAMVGSNLPTALLNVYSTTGSLTALTADAAGKGVLTGMGIPTDTPWNTAWSVQTAGNASTVVIRFPLGGAQIASKGPTIRAALPTQYPIISAAAFTSPNLDITYNVVN